jgi:hypothetical protein
LDIGGGGCDGVHMHNVEHTHERSRPPALNTGR